MIYLNLVSQHKPTLQYILPVLQVTAQAKTTIIYLTCVIKHAKRTTMTYLTCITTETRTTMSIILYMVTSIPSPDSGCCSSKIKMVCSWQYRNYSYIYPLDLAIKQGNSLHMLYVNLLSLFTSLILIA